MASMTGWRVVRRLLVACAIVGLPTLGHAQTLTGMTGSIEGRVTDNTNAVLPGVTVTVSSPAMMGTRDGVSSGEGLYRFPGVPPGTYTLKFELGGFTTVTREGIRVGLGFTATVNIEMGVATLEESVTVTGASPVVDVSSTSGTTRFDQQMLGSIPSSRDFNSLTAEAPAVVPFRIDVGGSGAGTQTEFRLYGTSSGQGSALVEGIDAAINGNSGMNMYVDYGALDEVAMSATAQDAEMATPGLRSVFITKSGGNSFHGDFYQDTERENWQAHNIDAAQIAAGVKGTAVLPAVELNRLHGYRDTNADIGGFIQKDKLWWYASVRDLNVSTRYTNFPVKPSLTHLFNFSAKGTYNLTTNNKLIVYTQPTLKIQPNRLDRLRLTSQNAIHTTEESTFQQHFTPRAHKLELDSVLSDAVFMEARGGEYAINWEDIVYKAGTPSYEDVGTNLVFGTPLKRSTFPNRWQVGGALTYYKNGWGGSHNIKSGGQWIRFGDRNTAYPESYNGVLHILNNGAPAEVYFFEPSLSYNRTAWTSAYVKDTWRVNSRLTLNLGVRVDQYRSYLPEQSKDAGGRWNFNAQPIVFPASEVLTWKNLWVPRMGASFNVSGNGRTVVKANYAKYYWSPQTAIASGANPNPQLWNKRYAWTDKNGNKVWDAGEEGRLIATSGGKSSTTVDPNLKDSFTNELVFWFEQELGGDIGLRTGYVWKGERQKYSNTNANQPYSAFNVPVQVKDPGPDGVVGTTDDGGFFTAYNLDAAHLPLPTVTTTANIPNSDSDFRTWETTLTKRMSHRWYLVASFAKTWSRTNNNQFFETNFRQNALPLTPNDLINTDDGRVVFNDWSTKFNGTWEGPWGFKLSPGLRWQKGQPYGRTFTTRLNYSNSVLIPAEKIDSHHQNNISILDLRMERGFNLGQGLRLSGFFDAYNVLNANPNSTITWNSGASYLRPVNIVAPRIIRLGTKLQF